MAFGTIDSEIQARYDDIKSVCDLVYTHPELCFAEYTAHDAYVAQLQKLGYKVTPHAYGVPTAFEAEYGSGGRLVVMNAEYDALPGIGHACGHNLIGAASLASFLSVAAQLKDSNLPGRVRLLGTPAEEGGGGKVALISKGAYQSVDACLMAHPARLHDGYSEQYHGEVYVRHSAIAQINVEFKGHTAHAAAVPWEGINALDAVVATYQAIGLLRQQIHPTERIHGIITNGGAKANIIPDRSSAEFLVRAPTVAAMSKLRERVLKCIEGAALVTGCEYTTSSGHSYADVLPSKAMCELFTEEMEAVGMPMHNNMDINSSHAASTDQGNVSYLVPSIHPCYGIPAKAGCANHTVGFTTAAGTDEAFERTLAVASGMARTAWKILTDDKVADRVKSEFETARQARNQDGDSDFEKLVSEWTGSTEPEAGQCACGHGKL